TSSVRPAWRSSPSSFFRAESRMRWKRSRADPASPEPIPSKAIGPSFPCDPRRSNLQSLHQHGLGRIHRGHVRLIGTRRRDHVGHFLDHVDIGHGHVSLLIGVGMVGIVNQPVGALVLLDGRHFHPAAHMILARGQTGRGNGDMVFVGRETLHFFRTENESLFRIRGILAQHHELPLVGAAILGTGGFGVGQIAGHDILADALGPETAGAYRQSRKHVYHSHDPLPFPFPQAFPLIAETMSPLRDWMNLTPKLNRIWFSASLAASTSTSTLLMSPGRTGSSER